MSYSYIKLYFKSQFPLTLFKTFQVNRYRMTLLTNKRQKTGADNMFEPCDPISFMHNEKDVPVEHNMPLDPYNTDEQRQPSTLYSPVERNGRLVADKSAMNANCSDEKVANHSYNCDRRNFDMETLSDQFEAIELIHGIKKGNVQYCEFKTLNRDGIDINGSVVHCRGPCIDVSTIYKKDDDGDTLLHIALIALSPDLALYFIDMSPHFSWLNVTNKLSQTPLHLAVLTNQASLVRRLVVGGADLESRDKDGNMAIHIACRENRLSALRALLLPVSYDEQKRNNFDIPFQKIPQNLEPKNYEGNSPLHIASLFKHFEIVKILIDSGADVNVRAEKSGRTILHDAAWFGNLALVKYLISLDNCCDINARTYDGNTAFDVARSRGHWSVVVELATAGAKYNNDNEEME